MSQELTTIENAPKINIEGIKNSIQEAESKALETYNFYKGCTTISDMKAARTEVRRVINNLEEERKGYTRDLDNFKDKLKGAYDKRLEPLYTLDSDYKKEIDKIAEQEREEKRKEIQALSDYDEFIKYFEFNDKWLQKKYTINDIEDEMAEGLKGIEEHKTAIRNTAEAYGMESHDYEKMLTERPLTAILEQIKKDKERLERQQQKRAEPKTDSSNQKPDTKPSEPKQKTAKVQTVTRKLTGTRDQFIELKKCADRIGVKIEEV